MMRECPCSTKIREGLENPSPPPSRFPLAMGFAPLDPRDFPRASPSGNPLGLGVQNPWPREISQDFPRPSRFPSGFALGKSLGSREILGVGDGFSNPSLLLVEHGYNLRSEYIRRGIVVKMQHYFLQCNLEKNPQTLIHTSFQKVTMIAMMMPKTPKLFPWRPVLIPLKN